MKVFFYTLGCKVNQVDTEELKEQFRQSGFEVLSKYQPDADLYIVNTCTVTHVSDRKSKALLRRLIRSHPQAMVMATGCLAQLEGRQLAEIEGMTMVISNQDKGQLVQQVLERIKKPSSTANVNTSSASVWGELKPICTQNPQDRYRAMVKIQDGCDSFCSFCLVPYARGPVRSKAHSEVLREIQHLVQFGYQEIVLTGIHLGCYGKDLKGWNLTSLLVYLLELLPSSVRVRLGSLEPLEVTEELLALFKQDERLCRHFHIPIQSGSNAVLKSMNRHYTRDYYYELAEKIVVHVENAALCSDIMVGFPNETPEDFQATLDIVRDLPFSDLHVFKYSMRPGTVAAGISNNVKETEKNRRSQALLQLAELKNEQFRAKQIGRTLQVLVDKKKDANCYNGLSSNYLEVEFDSGYDYRGQLIQVQMTDKYKGQLGEGASKYSERAEYQEIFLQGKEVEPTNTEVFEALR